MKKHNRLIIQICLIFTLLIGVWPSSTFAALYQSKGVLLQLNRSYILYSDQQMPYLDGNGRVLVPLRLVSDLMGASVSWNAGKKEATVSFDQKIIKLRANSKSVDVSGEIQMMDTVPVLKQATFMVPVRFISEVFGIPVHWDSTYKIVTLTDERFLKAKSLDRIDEMENLDEQFVGRIIPTNIRFVKGKVDETTKLSENILTIDVINDSTETIKPYQLHKNLYFYRSETSSGGIMTRGIYGPTGPSGYNKKEVLPGKLFADVNQFAGYSESKDQGGEIKYYICNYFKTIR